MMIFESDEVGDISFKFLPFSYTIEITPSCNRKSKCEKIPIGRTPKDMYRLTRRHQKPVQPENPLGVMNVGRANNKR